MLGLGVLFEADHKHNGDEICDNRNHGSMIYHAIVPSMFEAHCLDMAIGLVLIS